MTKKEAKRVIILGALSAIGEATCRLYAADGARMVLAGRSITRLNQVADDLQARGAREIKVWPLDFVSVDDPQMEFQRMAETLGGTVDVVEIFYGVLGDQKLAEQDTAEAHKILRVNFTSAVDWCLTAAALFERQKHGVLVTVSSVAGDRGRRSNYVYGAAKAGLTTLTQGIAHRLSGSGARAVVVKLGFVDTPMTARLKKSGPLWAKPELVAARIKREADGGHSPIVYVPSYWRWIMFLVRNLPAPLFHKTSF